MILLFAVVLVLATVHVNGRRVRRCVNINCRSRFVRTVISCSSRKIKGNINSVRVVKHHNWWCGMMGWHYKLHSHNKRVFQVPGKCSGVYRVCFTRGRRVRRCVNIRCRSRSGRTVVCSRRKIKGNIRLIRVNRRFRSAKCFRGINYMRSRNKKVLLVRGKCSAVFRVCFARA